MVTERNVGTLLAETYAVDERAPVPVEQGNIFAVTAEIEVCMQAGVFGIGVRPYQ
jgi:hypothetical protein